MNFKLKISEIFFILLLNFIENNSLLELDSDASNDVNSQLEIRAVIIKCQNENPDMSLEETTRFQREELFKHNALKNCKQKLAVTVKTSSVPNQVSGDEYIPINHVLDARTNRIRLLNPYVLRLRRKLPFQTYKLRRVDTVTGIILMSPDQKRMAVNESKQKHNLSRRSVNNQGYTTNSTTIVSALTFDNGNREQQNLFNKKRNLKNSFLVTSKTKSSVKNMDYYGINSKNDM